MHGVFGVGIYELNHFFGDLWSKLSSDSFKNLTADNSLRQILSVTSVRGHSVVGIGNTNDSCKLWNLSFGQAVRIPFSIQSFMMPAYANLQIRHCRDIF